MIKHNPIPMIREVVRFQSPDGQVFESEQQAQRHAEDLLCQGLESLLTLACPGMDRPSTQQAVLALEANQGETAKRLRIILALLEWGQDDGQ